ncbi:MAG: TRAP transporter small permease [Desulfobacterales bacterium]|nr:TRAP transporter small permease [Desulfobacterales bacterium]
MIILTCSNIFSRWVWTPVRGTFELMGFLGAMVAALALGQTQMNRGHIAVNVLINKFSYKTRRFLTVINSTICLSFFLLAAWQIVKLAETLRKTGEVTETLRIIYYPFIYAVALGCAVVAFVFFTELLRSLFSNKERL